MDLNGISAIVTGGASGLGAATATALAGRGAHVVLADLDRQADKGEALAKEIGGMVVPTDAGPADLDAQPEKGEALAKEIGGMFVATDVTDTDSIIAAVEAAKDMG